MGSVNGAPETTAASPEQAAWGLALIEAAARYNSLVSHETRCGIGSALSERAPGVGGDGGVFRFRDCGVVRPG